MKKIKSTVLFVMVACITSNIFGQANPTIAVLPANSGQVQQTTTLDLQITIGNTGTANIVANKLRPVITVPASVTLLADAQQLPGLPAGWSIVSNTGSQIRICNGTDVIAGSTSRTITLKVLGVTIAAPQTFSGQINFGGASCSVSGPAPGGNNTADDFATSTIEVIPFVVPLTLTDFSASLKDCQPLLSWTTETEINTDRFEIEKSNGGNTNDWKTIGFVAANGNSSSKLNYSFNDQNNSAFSEKVYYRLKMIDKDGKFTYSKILPVLINCRTSNVLVYPNPVPDGKLYISISGTVGLAEASLISSAGQIILTMKVNNGSNSMNVSAVADGFYLLKITDKNGISKTTKITIKH